MPPLTTRRTGQTCNNIDYYPNLLWTPAKKGLSPSCASTNQMATVSSFSVNVAEKELKEYRLDSYLFETIAILKRSCSLVGLITILTALTTCFRSCATTLWVHPRLLWYEKRKLLLFALRMARINKWIRKSMCPRNRSHWRRGHECRWRIQFWIRSESRGLGKPELGRWWVFNRCLWSLGTLLREGNLRD